MKTIIFTTVLSLMIVSLGFSQAKLRTVSNTAFKRGEKLNYNVYYHSLLTGNLLAGRASLEVQPTQPKYHGRNTMHIIGIGVSAGSFDWFFKVKDRYETYIDEKSIVPWYFVRRVNEGGYIINQDVAFNHFSNTVKCNDKQYKIPDYTQDILSFFYAARTMNTANLKPGDSFPLKFFLDNEVYTIKIIYEGKENVKISSGTYRCLKFKPMVLTGNVFKDPYPMTLWISDDQNHIPVLLKSEVIVGRVKLELANFTGLANTLTSKIK